MISFSFCQHHILIALPRLVKKAVMEGFRVVHMATLMWMDKRYIPMDKLPYLRLAFLAYEAAFIFGLMALSKKDYMGMGSICP